jgi:predicted PurR-regulated permease PerM
MNAREIALRTAIVVATVLALLVLWQVSAAVAVLLSALAISACLYPLVEHLQERGWPRLAAIGLAVAGSLVVVIGFVVTLAVPVASNVQLLTSDLTAIVEELVETSPNHWLLRYVGPLPTAEDASPASAPAIVQTVRSLVGTAAGIMELGGHAAICIALSVYWTIDRQRLERLWLSLVPVKRRAAAVKIYQSVERELGAYLRSELAQGLLGALLLWAGFEGLGLRYAALAAVVAAVLMMIPWLGNLLAIAAVLVLSSGKWMDPASAWVPGNAGFAAVYLIGIVLFLEFVIEPRLFNRDRYNSLWTALVTLALTYSFGVWGLLFGPPVGYGTQIILRQFYPLFFYEPAPPANVSTITARLAAMRERYPQGEMPPEVASLLDRLETLVQSHEVATSRG